MRTLVTRLVKEGWQLTGERKHYKLRSPTGKMLVLSKTPSCPRAIHNAERDIKRIMKNEQANQIHGDCRCGGET